MKTYVLYHKGCQDGLMAATIVNLYFSKDTKVPDYITNIPVQYGDDFPEMEDGSIVYIVDFSFDKEILLSLKDRMYHVVVLDHHKTAQEKLADIIGKSEDGKLEVIFDMDKCGASLTYDYFIQVKTLAQAANPHINPGQEATIGYFTKKYVKFVEDRDLWKWELPGSKEFSAALFSYPKDVETYMKLVSGNRDYAPSALIQQGKAILRYQNTLVESLVRKTSLTTIDDYEIPAVNSPFLQSEICARLLEEYPESKFSCCFFITEDGDKVYSLRSRPDFDCSEVAKARGGGGHAQACGFKE